MDTGRLNRRVVIERLEATTDPDYGSMINAWIPTHAAWASIEPLTGREYVAAMAVQAEKTVRIRIRYLAGITSEMRVTHMGHIFMIQSVINPLDANRELVLMCLEYAG